MKQFLLIVFLFLSACGFSPLYKEVSTEGQNVPVKVNPIPEQYGFAMLQIIQNKFGHPSTSDYTLTVFPPTFFTWDQTIDDKNFATIVGITGSVNYELVDNTSHKMILKNSVSVTSSYSVVKAPYATTVAERKVKKELAEQLAEQVSLHVLGTLAGVHK